MQHHADVSSVTDYLQIPTQTIMLYECAAINAFHKVGLSNNHSTWMFLPFQPMSSRSRDCSRDMRRKKTSNWRWDCCQLYLLCFQRTLMNIQGINRGSWRHQCWPLSSAGLLRRRIGRLQRHNCRWSPRSNTAWGTRCQCSADNKQRVITQFHWIGWMLQFDDLEPVSLGKRPETTFDLTEYLAGQNRNLVARTIASLTNALG